MITFDSSKPLELITKRMLTGNDVVMVSNYTVSDVYTSFFKFITLVFTEYVDIMTNYVHIMTNYIEIMTN